MVKVTVETDGRVYTWEENLAVVAVAHEKEDGILCNQAILGQGMRHLVGAAMGLARHVPKAIAESAGDPVSAIGALTVFRVTAETAVEEYSRGLLEKTGEGREGDREKTEGKESRK